MEVSNLEKKWIRLQEIGLVLALAIPNIIAIIAYTHGGLAGERTLNNIIMIIFFLGAASFMCIKYGAEKRQELKDKDNEKMQEVWAQRHPPADKS